VDGRRDAGGGGLLRKVEEAVFALGEVLEEWSPEAECCVAFASSEPGGCLKLLDGACKLDGALAVLEEFAKAI